MKTMYLMAIELENRKEYLKFYSKWAAIDRAKVYGGCVDVLSLVVTDAETGEIIIAFDQHELTWLDGYGEV